MSGKKRSEVLGVIRNISEMKDEHLGRKLEQCDKLIATIQTLASEGGEEVISNSNNTTLDPALFRQQQSERQYIDDSLKQLDQKSEKLNQQISSRSGSDYFDDEFSQAESLIQLFDDIEKNYINPLRTNLEKLRQAWKTEIAIYRDKQEKLLAEATSCYEAAKEKLNSLTLNNPLDKNAPAMSVSDYCEKILGDRSEFNALSLETEGIKQLNVSGDYEEAIISGGGLKTKLDQWVQEIEQKSEHILMTIHSAHEITSILEELGCKTQVEIIDGHIGNGCRITTAPPNETQFTCTPGASSDDEYAPPCNIEFNIDRLSNEAGCKYVAKSLQTNMRQRGFAFKVTDFGSETKAKNTAQSSTIKTSTATK